MTSNFNNDGRGFEKDLVRICELYKERGRAKLEKVEPPVRIIGWGPNRKVIFLPNPYLDFTGCWTEAGNRSLHFEAKSTTDPRLPCGGRDHFSMSQVNALRDWRKAGAGAFLLWEINGTVKLFFEIMINTALEERKSLIFSDGLKVPSGKGFLFFDFLSVLEKYPELI